MRTSYLFVAAVIALGPTASHAFGQDAQQDNITRINEVNQEQNVFFNKSHCDNLAATTYILTLLNSDSVREAFLWVGGAQDNCDRNSSRNNEPPVCYEVEGSQPALVEDNGNIADLTLQALTDTGVVNCENSSPTGEGYELYAFRDQAPGTNDVMTEAYGVAEFTVDVVPPSELAIKNQPELVGSSFTLSWNSPSDSENVPQYRVYQGSSADGSDVGELPVATNNTIGANEITINAGTLGLAAGETTYLFVTAVDNAATNVGDGNEGPLSEPTLVESAATSGFCDDPNVDCSGCSVSPMLLANGQPSSGLWVFGLLFPIFCRWRLRR